MRSARLAEMVWHVFKKDFRLLWPLSLGIVLLGALTALRTPFGGHFFGSQSLLEQFTIFLPWLANIGIAIVAVIAVQQDALSESQGDWLVRPLRRRDLALAKLLFVLLTVNVPLMIVDTLLQLALHFPLSVSIGVAASRALLMVLMCTLPGLMLGAVTRSLTNAVVYAISAVIVFVLLLAVATAALSPSLSAGFPVGVWIVFWLASAVIVIGSVATITLQYSTRRTPVARSIGLVTVFAALCMFIFLPRTVPLAIQEFLWGPPNSDGIRLSFDPSGRGDKSERAPSLGYGIGPPVTAAAASVTAAMQASVGREIEKVGLPLSITGTHPGDILFADRIAIRLVSMAGKVLYRGAGVCTRVPNGTACVQNQLEVQAGSADVLNEEELNLPIGR